MSQEYTEGNGAYVPSKSKSGYSDYSGIAQALSDDRTSWNKILRTDQESTATELITFQKGIKIGSLYLKYNATNNAIYIESANGSAAHFYASGDIAGHSQSGTTGGSGTGIDETSLWSILANAGTQQIAKNHLTTALSGYLEATAADKANWNNAYTNSHSHTNKSVIEGITSAKITNWDEAFGDTHTHNNATVLDGITATQVSTWDAGYTHPSATANTLSGDF